MIDSANKNMLYSTRKWFLCLVHTLFEFVICASSLVLPVLGGHCCRQNHSHYSARQRLISHRAAIPPLTGAKAAGRNAGQNAGWRNAAVERMDRCQTQRQLHGNGGVRRGVRIAAVQHQGKIGGRGRLTEKDAYLCMTVNRNTDGRLPRSKLAKLLHYNGSDLNFIGRRTGVCLFDYGMTPQEWRSAQRGKSG